MNRRAFSVVSLASLAAIFATPAFARRRRRFGIGGGMTGTGNYSGNVLTVDALESCVRQEREIEDFEARIDESELNALQSQIDDLSDRIQLSEVALDQYSQTSIDAHNQLIDGYNQFLAQYREKQAYYNSAVYTLNSMVDDFNFRCAEKSYYEADMRIVMSRIGL